MNLDRTRTIFFPIERTDWESLLESLKRESEGEDNKYKQLYGLFSQAREVEKRADMAESISNLTTQESDDSSSRKGNDDIISGEEIHQRSAGVENNLIYRPDSESDSAKIAIALYAYLNSITERAGEALQAGEEEPSQNSVKLWNYYRQGIDLLTGSSIKFELTRLLDQSYSTQSSRLDSFWWYVVNTWIHLDSNRDFDDYKVRLTDVEKSEYLIWPLKRLLRVELAEDGTEALYYTSLASLDYIFPSEKDAKGMKGEGESYRFKPSVMSVSTMNDPEEGHVLQEYLDEANKYTHRYWWNLAPIDGEEGQRYYCIEPYVFCKSFTNRERLDDLSMWEVYGDRSEGVCCVVRIHGDSESNLYNVAYLNRETKSVVQIGGEHKNETNKYKFDLLDTLLVLLQKMVSDSSGEKNGPKEWRKRILEIAYLFKYDSYSHENEMRYLDSLVDADAQSIKSRVEPVGGSPVEKTLPILSVKSGIAFEYEEVILGPKVKNPDHAAAYLIYKFTAAIGDNSVPLITKSAVRYR